MKVVGYLLGACVILAIVRAVATVLALSIILVLIIGAICKPRETLAWMAFVLIANLCAAFPFACLTAGALAACAAVIKFRQTD
ncbi:MAG: hypothetical protein BVN32_12540 [Proteobacteria bacterium ST_bin14]|nr:MAG: hypothetical protein BVN32_12540 [Proteobacteria bacterium ST_bin14]